MRKSIVRVQGLYLALFALITGIAQAAPLRRFDPEAPRQIFVAIFGNWQKILETIRTLDVLCGPIG